MWIPISPEASRQRLHLPWGWNYSQLWILQHSFWETNWWILQEPYPFLSTDPLASHATPVLARGSPLSPLPSLFSPFRPLALFSLPPYFTFPFLSLPLSLLPSLFITLLFYLSFPPSFECQISQQLIGNYWIFWMRSLRNLFAWSKWKNKNSDISV